MSRPLTCGPLLPPRWSLSLDPTRRLASALLKRRCALALLRGAVLPAMSFAVLLPLPLSLPFLVPRNSHPLPPVLFVSRSRGQRCRVCSTPSLDRVLPRSNGPPSGIRPWPWPWTLPTRASFPFPLSPPPLQTLTMTSVQEIDERLAAEELTDLKPEEEPYADACKATLTDEQKKMVTDLDIIQVVRGYETYEPRMEETVKAFKVRAAIGTARGSEGAGCCAAHVKAVFTPAPTTIADDTPPSHGHGVPRQEIIEWREKVNYPMYLQERLDKDELFYKSWPEHIYGEDKYGHPLISMRISEMDTDKLHDIEECVALHALLWRVSPRPGGPAPSVLTPFAHFVLPRLTGSTCCGCRARSRRSTPNTSATAQKSSAPAATSTRLSLT